MVVVIGVMVEGRPTRPCRRNLTLLQLLEGGNLLLQPALQGLQALHFRG
jgi:hypothetical protein